MAAVRTHGSILFRCLGQNNKKAAVRTRGGENTWQHPLPLLRTKQQEGGGVNTWQHPLPVLSKIIKMAAVRTGGSILFRCLAK